MRKERIAGIIAAIATVIASLGIGSAAVAAPPAPPTSSGADSITLTSQSGASLKNHTFKAYQLTGYIGITTSGTGSSAVVTGVSAKKVTDAVEGAITTALTNNGITVPGGDNAAEATLLRLGSETPATSQGKIAAVADSLAAPTSIPSVGKAISGVVVGSTVTFSNLTPGYYLVVDSGQQSKPVILSSTINGLTKLNSQTIGSGEIKTADGIQTNPEKKMFPFKHTPDSKSIADSLLNPSENHQSSPDGSVTVGNTYDFELTFYVPNSKSYATFSGVDTPTGMTIDPATVKMAIGDVTETNPLELVGLTANASVTKNGLKFSINTDGSLNFVPDPNVTVPGTDANPLYNTASQFVLDNSGKRVTITYSAKIVKKDAENTFQLKLNPLHGNSLTPPAVTVKTHSYSVQLHKISAADRDQNKDTSVDVKKPGLSGAKFKVQKKNGNWLQFAPATSTTDAQWTEVDDEASASTLTTDTKGNISLPNLGSGTYIVKETTAPAGYMSAALPQATVTITQDAAHPANATVTANGNDDTAFGGLVDTLTDGQYIHADSSVSPTVAEQIPTFVVANINSITQLPQTGGAGIIAIALLLAVLLIAGVGIGFAARRIGERRLSSQK
jgi:hypothetical protein